MRRIPGVLTLLLLLLVPISGRTEMLGRGTYHGYVRQDRWGQKILQQGPYVLFLSEAVFKQLEVQTGQPLAVEVSDLLQPVNPGSGLIQEVASSTIQDPEHDVSLQLRADQERIRAGEGLLLTVTVRNLSDPKLWWPIKSLAVVFTRQSGDLNAPGPNGENMWPYRAGFQKHWNPQSERLLLAAREIPLEWNAGNFKSIDACNSDRIPPGAIVEQEVIVGTDLPPGEYEVFVYWKTGNFSYSPGAMSEAVAFDVVERGDL